MGIATGLAHATTGALTFSSCVQHTGDADPSCTPSSVVKAPTTVTHVGGQEALLVASGAPGDAVATFAHGSSGATLTSTGCFGDGTLSGCGSSAYTPIADPVGLASLAPDVTYVAAEANNAIVTLVGSTPTCVSENGTVGCAVGSGMHHPRGLALAPDGLQLYAATDDGVAWFTIDPQTHLLTFAGCLAAGSADGCGATVLAGANSIAVNPNGRSVMATSSDGTVSAFARGTGGALSQGTCFQENPGPIPTCIQGHGIGDPNDVAISPDGHSAHVVSTANESIASFSMYGADLGSAGCLASTAGDTCTSDPALHLPVSVAVSPESDTVYASDTKAEVSQFSRDHVFNNLTAGPCIGPGGGACDASALSSHAGGVTVSADGRWVDAVSPEANGIVEYARTRATADLSLALTDPPTANAPQPGALNLTFTLTNHGPDTADGAYLTTSLPSGVTLAAVNTSGALCSLSGPPVGVRSQAPPAPPGSTPVTCVFAHHESGSAGQVVLTIAGPPGTSGTITATDGIISPVIDDPNATNDTAAASFTFPVICPVAGSARAADCPSLAVPSRFVLFGPKLKPSSFAVAGTPVNHAKHRHPHLGSTITYSLTDPARAAITIFSIRSGHRVGKACKTTAHRGHVCTVTTRRGTILGTGKKGANTVKLSGRLNGKALPAGRYQAIITATANGQTVTSSALAFTIVRR